MVSLRDDGHINFKHVYLFYFAFVLILSASAFFYFTESTPSTIGFVISQAECNVQICPYFAFNNAGYNKCVLELGQSRAEDCNFCLMVYGCAGYVSPTYVGDEPTAGTTGLPLPPTSIGGGPTQMEIEISKSYFSQTASASEYAKNIVERVLYPKTTSGLSAFTSSLGNPSFISPLCYSSSEALKCTKENLILTNKKLDAVEDLIELNIKESNYLLEKYPGQAQIVRDNSEMIKLAIGFENIASQLNSQLSLVVNIALEKQREEAQQQILTEKNKGEILDYYQDISGQIPKNKDDDCSVPLQIMIYEGIKGGVSSINSEGKECFDEPLPVDPYITQEAIVSSSSGNNLAPSQSSSGNSGSSIVSVFLIAGHGLSDSNNYEALIISKGVDNFPRIGFLLAPTHIDLEKKIADLTRNLFFGSSDALSDMTPRKSSSAHVSDSGIYSKQIPWFLWITFGILLISFLVLGSLVSIDKKYLISQGKKDLLKKDFASAVKNYNSLLYIYNSFDDEDRSLKNSILEYKHALLKSLKEASVKYTFRGSLELPEILLQSDGFSHLGHEGRVSKLIDDAIRDAKVNRNIATGRLPIIAELYSKLDTSSQKKLAHKYESLVFSLRQN